MTHGIIKNIAEEHSGKKTSKLTMDTPWMLFEMGNSENIFGCHTLI